MGLHKRYEEILEEWKRMEGDGSGCEMIGGEDVARGETAWRGGRDEERLRRAFERMMRRLHEAEEGAELRVEFLAEEEPQAFIREHQRVLSGALEEVEMSESMRSRLNSSHYVFSGLKTFHELKEAFPELTREDGSRKSFREFLEDVRKVDETYNGSWLRAEYNFAHRSAQMAARWEASERHGERYLLQYRTQSDDKVRPEHAALHGVTLEKGDGFWDYYLPPNGWGCRCTVVEVLRDQYARTPHDEAMELGAEATRNDRRNMFRWNSGKKGRTFPDYNPYTISRCRDCDVNSGKGRLAFVPDNEVCEACRVVRECAGDKEKSERAIERTHYLHKMEPLLQVRYEKPIDVGTIKVGFSTYGNKHLFSDTFGRSRVLLKEDLKDLGTLLENSTYLEDAALTHTRRDNITHFYYYKAELHGRNVRLNVAKDVEELRNGRIIVTYYLYSINDLNE